MVLGQAAGMVSVGEIKFIWQRGLAENRRCGCGTPLRACPFWRQVLSEAFGSLTDERVAALDAASRRFRTRHLGALLLPGAAGRYGRDLHWYRDDLLRLYRAVLAVSGAQVVVDSSKYPAYLFCLRQIPELDIRVAHVIRDPRAVAYSWQRDRPDPDAPGDGRMPRMNPAVTGLYWSVWNAATERIAHDGGLPRLAVRYEDLVARPHDTVTRLLELAGTDATAPLTEAGALAAPQPHHLVSGNPIRLSQGELVITADEAWRTEMRARDRRLAATTSAPLRRRYRY
jgi:hypothetical protein